MGDKSKISWTDATWNPLVGCTRVSEGCRNCYAERVAATRLKDVPAYKGIARVNADGEPRWTGEVRLLEERLDQPLRWRRPRMVFVNSMSDLFHESVHFYDIATIFGVMARAQQHRFQVLTKRPARMLEFFEWLNEEARGWSTVAGGSPHASICDHIGWKNGLGDRSAGEPVVVPWPLPNVWLGVSVEDQQTADERIPLLLQTPAAVRWISAEPLLGPIDLCDIVIHDDLVADISQLSWIVVGGESGPDARPMSPGWARAIRDQAIAAGVPFHFKQFGEWAPSDSDDDPTGRPKMFLDDAGLYGGWVERVGKRAAGRRLDDREWNEYPAMLEEEV